jgi:DNA-binding beta-propeller fold protein YncE
VTPNSGSEDLSVYRFDTSTGNLFLIGKPIPLGAAGIKAAFSSDGKYLYVTTINTVVVFSVDSPGGAVSTLTGSPLNTGPAPTIVAAF